MSKIMVVAAAAAGYVLGSRAGREHYEVIKKQAQKLRQSPQVQQATAQATEAAKDAADKVADQSSASGNSRQDTEPSGGRHAQTARPSTGTPVSGDDSGALS